MTPHDFMADILKAHAEAQAKYAPKDNVVVTREVCYGCGGKGEVWRRVWGGFESEPDVCSICAGRGEIITEQLAKP